MNSTTKEIRKDAKLSGNRINVMQNNMKFVARRLTRHNYTFRDIWLCLFTINISHKKLNHKTWPECFRWSPYHGNRKYCWSHSSLEFGGEKAPESDQECSLQCCVWDELSPVGTPDGYLSCRQLTQGRWLSTYWIVHQFSTDLHSHEVRHSKSNLYMFQSIRNSRNLAWVKITIK